MAHTRAFRKFVQILQQARRTNHEAKGLPQPLAQGQWRQNRRDFIKNAAAAGVAGLIVSSFPGCSLRKEMASPDSFPRVVIIGGGLAGLNAAYQLKKAGVRAKVCEARKRLGGRVFSRDGIMGNGLTVELGAEFINSDHADMVELVSEFGLQLFDRHADARNVPMPACAYYFDGKSWSDAELAELLRPLVDQISGDAQLIDQDWDKYAPQFDRMSVREYLDHHTALIPQPIIRTIVENAIRIEFGVEAHLACALQLLFLLPTVEGNSVEILGYSDEAYTVAGGNTRLIEALASALPGQIKTGMVLEQLDEVGKENFKLQFQNGKQLQADFVVLAMPFTALRQVRINAPLPQRLKHFIQQVDLGMNEKLLAGYSKRAWRQAPGFSLEAWTDLGFSEVWDGTQRQSSHSGGSLTYYMGGKEVGALNSWPGGAGAAGPEFTKRLSRFVRGLDAHATGTYSRTAWARNPYTGGAYVNYQPGQLTQFGNYLWIESDDPARRQAVHAGRLVFAGEHLSEEYYGFMNGAAQTGRLAAQLVYRMIVAEDVRGAKIKATQSI